MIVDHEGKRLFITGIPTAGKSYLAKKLSKATDGVAVCLDIYREELAKDERYKKWVNFYFDLDEEKYFTEQTPEELLSNQDLIDQSEALWPAFLEKIKTYENETRPVIFECVNMLPHLAKRDLDFPGIVLLGPSYEDILRRNIEDPRWGKTLRLQELEAKSFWEIERPFYKEEAEKFGYSMFDSADQAFEYALKLIS